MKFENELHTIEVRGHKIGVIQVPVAGSAIQFVLATNDINEIVSVGYLDFDGKVTWNFGKPSDEFVTAIEEELRKLIYD